MGKKTTKIGKLPDFNYTVRIDTFKARDKVVKRIERIVRSSMEYRDYIVFLKDNLDFNQCAFFSGVKNANGIKSRIEIHHDPFTLYDIVDIVLRKFEEEGKPINEMYIADEVIELHYRNLVGLIPLSKTVHEIIHSSLKTGSEKLFIPLNIVFGDFRQFIEEYGDYIDDPIYERYKYKVDRTKSMTEKDFECLYQEYEYLNISGVQMVDHIDLPEEEEIIEEVSLAS